MKIEEKRPMSFRTLIMAVFACITLLVAVLIALSYAPKAFAGDATSFNPTSVAVQARAASDTPIGGVIPYRGNSVPDGWLECNGQSTAGYPELAAVVGANVPDLRGEFIRGLDSGRGIDAGRTLGSAQADDFMAHSHSMTVSGSGTIPYNPLHSHGSGPINAINAPNNYNGYRIQSTLNIPFTASGTSSSAGGSENRPRNVALMYIIKAE